MFRKLSQKILINYRRKIKVIYSKKENIVHRNKTEIVYYKTLQFPFRRFFRNLSNFNTFHCVNILDIFVLHFLIILFSPHSWHKIYRQCRTGGDNSYIKVWQPSDISPMRHVTWRNPQQDIWTLRFNHQS